GLFMDGSDNLYITEGHGARVLKFRTSDRTPLLIIGMAGLRLEGPGTLVEPRDVAVDQAGNIWIADGNVVYQYDSAGNYRNRIGAAAGSGNYQFNYVNGVAFDSAGRLYVSDNGNHRIQVYTFNPSGEPVYFATIGQTGVPGSDDSHFRWPAKIAVDSLNRLYVADNGNHRIQRCVYAGGTSWTCSRFHGTGSAGSGADQLAWPWGVSVDRNNNVYIADTANNRVKKCDPNGNCTVFATGLNFPTDVAVDSAGNVYVCNAFAFTVLKYSSTGAFLQTFAGTDGVPYVTDNRYFNTPSGIAVDSSGNIYFTEEFGYRLVKLNAAGVVQWQVGTPGVWGRDNARFGNWRGGPRGVAVGPTGRVYVADPNNARIQVYDSNGNYVATLGGSWGSGDYQFNWPVGVAVDGAGNLYVADVWNHRVQVYDSNLVYKRTLGETRVPGSDNAHFRYPYGVAVDRNGNIYVADTENFRVQVFNSQGTYLRTLGVTGEQGEDFAHFVYPLDVAVDAGGRVYVKDAVRIQVFDQNGAYLTTIGGASGVASGQFTGPTSV
ncbi:MAG: SBBP repeat-containing protein, partial [Anaerolineae bacterium]